MLVSALISLAMAAPSVEATWKGPRGELMVVPDAGYHVSPDAYVDWKVSWGESSVAASVLGTSVSLPTPDLRGRTLDGEVTVSICDDAGTTCQRMTLGFFGALPQTKKGDTRLLPKDPKTAEKLSPYQADASKAADAAFAEAKRRQTLVLLDFGAVWCPPCNQMQAEIFDSPNASDTLQGFTLVTLDVDDPSSWALKDKYAVAGYPTVVAVQPDGREVSRLVGYEGENPMIAWLSDTRRGGLAARVAKDPATVTPSEAADTALDLVKSGTGDAAPWLARASENPDVVAFRLARWMTAPTLEDGQWLADHSIPPMDWAPAAGDLGDTPEGKALLRKVFARYEGSSSIMADADRLAYLADLTDDESAKTGLYGAAVVVLAASFTGVPAHDRPYYTTIAEYMKEAGDLEGALFLLNRASTEFPSEPTFYLAAGRMLLDADRTEEALVQAQLAMPLSWGDNRLRVATLAAKALVKLGRQPEAQALAEKTLEEIPVPAEGLDVRTGKYRDALTKAAAKP